MNTLKAKIVVFFLATTFIIFTALAVLILKMEREDRIDDLRALLHHLSSEIITDHLDLPHPLGELGYLKGIELIRTLSADKALSNPTFQIVQDKNPGKIPPNTIIVLTKLPQGNYFLIGSDTRIIDKNIGRLAITLYLLFFGALGLFAIVFYSVLKKMLDPMEQLALSCATIDLEGDPKRFPVSTQSVEIERLGSALQSLVDRIAFLREKERQMFKETAHQFKTPLAILKARIDRFALDESFEKELFIRQANSDIAKLLKYLKELLIAHESRLSDAESPSSIDVKTLLSDISAYASPLLQRKRQSIELESGETFTLKTYPVALKKLILTVLENCINHAPDGSIISIGLDSKEHRIIFANRITDRETPTLFNSNLGLKIIRELSLSLGIGVSVEHQEELFLLTLNAQDVS